MGLNLSSVFGEKIEKNFIKGISKLSKEYNVPLAQMQIRVTLIDSDTDPVRFQKCIQFVPVENSDITYREVMDIKFDLINEEAMVKPTLANAMASKGMEMDIAIEDLSIYFYTDGKSVGVVIYDKNEYKKICPIRELLEEKEEN